MTKSESNPPRDAEKVTIATDQLARHVAAHGTFIPLNGKRPIHASWTKRNYSSAKVLAWCVEQNSNVGVRLPASVVVVDIDPRNGGDQGWDDLCMEYGLDDTAWPCVVTGSGGRHYYLSKPADVAVLDTVKDFPGVEFKSKGRQVVAAGSIHPDTGRHYRWKEDGPDPAVLPDIPDDLLQAIRRPERTASSSNSGGELDPSQVAVALARFDVTNFRNHDQWLRLMMSVHNATNGDARQEWIDWCTSDPKYADQADAIGRRWDSLHDQRGDGMVTIGTLRHFLAEVGALDALPPDQDAARDDFDGFEGDPSHDEAAIAPVESRGMTISGRKSEADDTFMNAIYAVIKSGIEPAFDLLSQKVEFKNPLWDASFGSTFNDHLLRVVRVVLSNKFQGNGYQPSEKNVLDAIMTVAFRNQFNPVLDYLAELKWDGVNRLERIFVDYFPCGDDAYTRAVGLCFGVGAVRRQRQPGCKFDTAPILLGAQGWGKSTGIAAWFGRKWFTDAELGSLRDKDAALTIRGVWAVELAELTSLSRWDTAAHKAFLSRGTDRQRDPYGRVAGDHPRRCVFIGTGNENGALKDSTGARRYWPLRLADRVDVARIIADRDQLWAEAAAREARGESTVLPEALWPMAAERQAEQTSEDPWADVLRAFLADRDRAWHGQEFEPDADVDGKVLPPDRVHTAELFDALSIPTAARTTEQAQRLRKVMEAVLGWKYRGNIRVGDNQGRGYGMGAAQ